jgi:pSer/pThr/pTyr-binding forkhead associated (FHA) protein
MSSTPRYRLTMRKGPLPGKMFELNKALLTIGREVKNDIVINDGEVSRQHVRFSEQDDGYRVEDLASTNGTFVNGQRLSGSMALRPGDILGLGSTVELEFDRIGAQQSTVVGNLPAAETGLNLPPVNAPLDPVPAFAPASPPPPVTPPAASPMFSPASAAAAAPASGFQMKPWMWAVGAGCALLVVCVCLVGVALAFLGPSLNRLINP